MAVSSAAACVAWAIAARLRCSSRLGTVAQRGAGLRRRSRRGARRARAQDSSAGRRRRGRAPRTPCERTRRLDDVARSRWPVRAVPAAGRSETFQVDRHDRHRQEHGHPGNLESALARGDRAVIADPDGGYLQRFYDPARGDVVLNPFDARSVKWDLFAEIKSPYDVEQLARSLIPDHEGADRSWRGYARTFFTAVTRQAHEAGVTDMAELYRLLVVADTSELRTLVRGTPAQPFLDEHNSRMFDSIRSVTSSAVGALDYVAQQKAERFSIREWVNERLAGRSVHSLQGRSDRGIALDHFGVDAPGHLRGHGSGRAAGRAERAGSKRLVVRRRRIGCAGPDRRAEGRARAPAQIRRPLRAWVFSRLRRSRVPTARATRTPSSRIAATL